MPKTNEVREIERGEILRFLAELGFAPATPRTLRVHLDHAALSVGEDQMEFHLRYLIGKGFIIADSDGAGTILCVRITPAGVDLLDRRRAGDPGVRF